MTALFFSSFPSDGGSAPQFTSGANRCLVLTTSNAAECVQAIVELFTQTEVGIPVSVALPL